uniref:Peptidase A2 domain-containing protein n=1 Tax=Rhabditophanes sp. KR3021 TaxID=114890 RepID=A0AC35TKK4_9BILA
MERFLEAFDDIESFIDLVSNEYEDDMMISWEKYLKRVRSQQESVSNYVATLKSMLGDLAKKESMDDLILAKLIGELSDAVKNKLAGKKIDLGAVMGELAKDSLAKKAIAIRRGQSVEFKKEVATKVVGSEKTENKSNRGNAEVLPKREYIQRELRPITMGVTTWEDMAPMDWDIASMIFKAIAFGPLIFTALVDSGSEINVLPAEGKEKFQRMNFPVEDLNVTIKGAGKTKAIGRAKIQLTSVETTKSVFTDVFFVRGVKAVVTSKTAIALGLDISQEVRESLVERNKMVQSLERLEAKDSELAKSFMVHHKIFDGSIPEPKIRVKFDYEAKPPDKIFKPYRLKAGQDLMLIWSKEESSHWERKKDFFGLNSINSMNFSPGISPMIAGYPNMVSRGEVNIDAFLDSYRLLNGQKLIYSKRKTYPGLVGEGRSLSFDFIVGNNLLIEFDGEQHFKPSGYPNGADALERQRRYDQMKNNYCRNNGLHLIRISYSRAQEISTILSNVIERWAAGLRRGEILAEFYGNPGQY